MFDTSEKATQFGTGMTMNQKQADLLTDTGSLLRVHWVTVSHQLPPPPGNSKLHNSSPTALTCPGAGDKWSLWTQRSALEAPDFLLPLHKWLCSAPPRVSMRIRPSPNHYWAAILAW